MKRLILIFSLLIILPASVCTAGFHSIPTGCMACQVYVPNAFSPNDDAVNNEFRAFVNAECMISEYAFRIFDRWGNLVFESTSPAAAWDGTFKGEPAPQSVYLYFLQYTFTDAESGETEIVEQTGDLYLMR